MTAREYLMVIKSEPWSAAKEIGAVILIFAIFIFMMVIL